MSDFCNQQSTSAPFGHKARQLTVEEIVKLTEDKELVSAFRQQKLEKDAKKNWDLFYKRNLDKFFKDRHWTIREFEELLGIDLMQDGERRNLLEAGCGVGNFLWPLIKSGLPFNYYACDFSPVAVDLVRKHELYRECNCKAFVADLTEPNGIKCRVKDDIRFHLVSLIFVLSAIHPEKMVTALESIHQVLAVDGILLFRDYGLYDYAQLRFSAGQKLAENFYVRQDGTRAYYFSLETLRDLLRRSNFEIVELDYVKRETINHKEGLSVPRIFIQGKFRPRKP